MSNTHRGERTWTTYWQEMTPQGVLYCKGGGLIAMTQEQAWDIVRKSQLRDAHDYDKAPGWWLSHFYTYHIISLGEAQELAAKYPTETGQGWRQECSEGSKSVSAT